MSRSNLRSDLERSGDWLGQGDDLERGDVSHAVHGAGARVCDPESFEAGGHPVRAYESLPGLIRENSVGHESAHKGRSLRGTTGRTVSVSNHRVLRKVLDAPD